MKIAALFSIILMLFLAGRSFAQDQNYLTLGINPPLLEIQAVAPAEVMAEFSVTNKSENKVDLNFSVKPFKLASSGTGAIEFLPSNTFVGEDPELYSKIKILDSGKEIDKLTLGPKQSKQLSLLINIDEGSPASDYYFSIVFTSNPLKEGGSASSFSGGIGTNVILSIGGDSSSATGAIDEFSSPLIVTSNSVPFTLSVSNKSAQYIKPKAEVRITDMFGRDAGIVTAQERHILAGGKRYLSTEGEEKSLTWKGNLLFGVYKATASVNIAEGGQNIKKSITFFAFPIYLLFALSFFSFLTLSIYLRVKKKVAK